VVTELLFDQETHTYTQDGIVIPSVTQVLQGAGLVDTTWFTEESRNRGTYIHTATALFDKGVAIPGLRDEMTGYLAAWARFREETGFVPVEIETPHLDELYWYAGTPDRFGYWDVQLSHQKRELVLDIKSGDDLPSYALQTAAYRRFYPKSGFDRAGVHLRKNGTYKVAYHTDVKDWDMFVSALNVYKWKETHGVK
jgi:hypothetical protein